MSRGMILYCSEHHENTEKLVKEVCKNCPEMKAVSLMNVEAEDVNLSDYETIGFASGVYKGKPHDFLLKYIEENKNVLQSKSIYTILTSGSNQGSYGRWFSSYIGERGLKTIGCYQCRGWDTYGLWRFIGGIAKKHPNRKDVEACTEFIQRVICC